MSDAPDITASVTKKIGPLPGWAWVVVVAGAAWGIHLWKGRSSGAPAPAALSTDVSVAPSGFPSGTGNAGGFSGGGSGAVTGGALGTPSVKTNAMWVKSTTDQMVAAGSDASAVSNALTTYVSGGQLDSNGQSIVNQAITHYGAPPEGTLPVKSVASLPLQSRYTKFIQYAGDITIYGLTPEGQEVGLTYPEYLALGKPPFEHVQAHALAPDNAGAAHIYIAKDGDTFDSISARFYGKADAGRLGAANPGVPYTPPIGQPIYVP